MVNFEELEATPPMAPAREGRERSDRELLRAVRDGSDAAAEALVGRHWDRAYRIAYGILGDAHAAEDVTQEAMLSLLANVGRFDTRRPFEPWLHRIVSNRALDWLRGRNRRAEVAPLVAPAPSEPPSDPALATALASLPPEQRAVVVLRHLGGYGTNEIARMLGLPRGTVGSRLRRGLDQLRAQLAVALLAICIALAAGAIFTSPGQAVTSWIGDRLGFGEPGGPPTLRDLRAFATEGSAADGQPAYVLLRGPAADIGHYELVTYRSKDEPGKSWPANGARCFELNFPEARALMGPRCGLPPAEHGLRFDGTGGGVTRSGSEYLYASGRVSDDVESVEISFEGKQVAVELTPIPEDLIERFRIRRPFKFFITFFEDVRDGGIVTVIARDGEGRVVAQRRSKVVVFPADLLSGKDR
jgi:RNA polymerase sigma-70 factor, ECF subfamily